MMMCQVNIQL